MPRIALLYVLFLAVVLVVLGIYGVLSRTTKQGIARGIFLMLSGVAVGLLGFLSVLPIYYVKPWLGYGALLFVLAAMARYGKEL